MNDLGTMFIEGRLRYEYQQEKTARRAKTGEQTWQENALDNVANGAKNVAKFVRSLSLIKSEKNTHDRVTAKSTTF